MKEGGIVRRLFDVSVSILMATVLLMGQSWAVTAAYADYLINGSADSTNFYFDDSAAIEIGQCLRGKNRMLHLWLASLKTRNRLHPKRQAKSLLMFQPKAIS